MPSLKMVPLDSLFLDFAYMDSNGILDKHEFSSQNWSWEWNDMNNSYIFIKIVRFSMLIEYFHL